MIAGPAALAVALSLLPGWIYWRTEGTPRTARTALGELFEVVGAGTIASGATALGYVTLAHWCDKVIQPDDLSRSYVRQHLTAVAWLLAALVATACVFAFAGAHIRRMLRSRSGDKSQYLPDKPLWVSALGSKPDTMITVEVRGGRKLTGYLEGHDVDDQGAPSLYLTPPILDETTTVAGWRRVATSTEDEFSDHAVTIPGSEVVAVWTPYEAD